MFDQRPAFLAACGLTAICILSACALALFGPPTPPVTKMLDALIYISIAGALAIFGLLGTKPPDNKPPATS